ncbi:hypothetical protein DET49_12320 [Salegentibacter sp. 24]|nr:hypothetical protein DET49_12320 [Salegentibacter sp. 24]
MYLNGNHSVFEKAEISGAISQELVDEVKAIYENIEKINEEKLRQQQERFIEKYPDAL